MQLNFQQKAYEIQFPGAENFVIKLENERVGRLIIYRDEKQMRIVDIAVLPDFRGKGIASYLIGSLITEAEKSQRKLALQVLKTNINAFNLYKKLGFAVVGETEMNYLMER